MLVREIDYYIIRYALLISMKYSTLDKNYTVDIIEKAYIIIIVAA